MISEILVMAMPDENAVENDTTLPTRKQHTRLLGTYLIALPVILLGLLFWVWPVPTGTDDTWVPLSAWGWKLGDDTRLLVIVVIAAALGGYIHAATSFADFVGNRSFEESWRWWYVLRNFIGIALALLFYFVVRGGLLATNADANEMSVYGIAAVAGLSGLFSKQATDKLEEVFTTLFKTETGRGDDLRKDKLRHKKLVSEVMIPVDKIRHINCQPGDEKSVPFDQLKQMLKNMVTRVIILQGGNRILYLIHQSLIFRFIAEKHLDAEGSSTEFKVSEATLADLLGHADFSEVVSGRLAFVPLSATVGDAKRAMNAVEGCQDVIVTANGDRNEPVAGWLTNADIARLLER